MNRYDCMTELYADPDNVEGTTYGKRWRRHEWSQMVEKQASDNPETQKIVMAIHGGGIEPGTTEIALAAAGYHPATLLPATDGQGLHDFWIFEGLLKDGNEKLHVTASNYNEPIATELVQNARRCISLHGCMDRQANVSNTHPMGLIQIGGLDLAFRDIVLAELTAAGIPAEVTTDPDLLGTDEKNIGNRTQIGGCVQLEMGKSYRAGLFETNTRPQRKHTTNAQFWLLIEALRQAMSRVGVGPTPAMPSCDA